MLWSCGGQGAARKAHLPACLPIHTMHMLAENSRCSCRHSVGNMRASCLASQGRCSCMLIKGRNTLLWLASFPLFVNIIGLHKRNTFILLICCVFLLSQFSQKAISLSFFLVFGKRNAECTRLCGEEGEGGEKIS